ncbi:MAG: hypothetical protein RIT27_775 [Pseudomonadota bacterium]
MHVHSCYCADGNGNGCGVFCANTKTIMRWVVKVTFLATIGVDEFFAKIGGGIKLGNRVKIKG